MNATAELATPNGPQQSLLIDDSSSSNTFYAQHLGISLFDDSIAGGGLSTGQAGQLQQLINFSVSTKRTKAAMDGWMDD